MPQTSAPPFRAFDRAAARWADALIAAYQRWLSPLKGKHRGCAHRVRYGGDSCSQHVRRLLAEAGGVSVAIPLARARFSACREAAETAAVRNGVHPRHLRSRGQCCIVIPCGTTGTVRV